MPPPSFLVLPVVDLLGGTVVHAVGGLREQYQPIQSVLCGDARPAGIANALRQQLGLNTCYVADLDALEGRSPQWSAIGDLRAAGLTLWLDAGCTDERDVGRVVSAWERCGDVSSRVILALESWRDPARLSLVIHRFAPRPVVFSLDLRHGVPVTRSSPWKGTIEDIVRHVIECGVTEIILLDLARVGRAEGNWACDLLAALRAAHPRAAFYVGGGVRHAGDLRALAEAGAAGALVGTALHRGTIGVDDLVSLGGIPRDP